MEVKVIAHPNSKKTDITIDLLENIHVYIKEPAREGRANDSIILALAKHFQINKTTVKLIKGKRSKYKVFEITLKA